MYRVEIPLDSLQQAAITRRQNLDRDRKTRIFDPKIRTIGIDAQALDEQIRIKNAIKAVEAEREAAFDQYSKYTNQVLTIMDDRTAQARRDHLAAMNRFRQGQQQPHQRRDFDLYDPLALKKDRPARVGDADPRCGVSGCQRFEGEDLEAGERERRQKEQRRVWAEMQVAERDRKRREEEEEKRRYDEYQQNLADKTKVMQKAIDDIRAAQAKDDYKFNQRLAAQKKQREAVDRLRDLEQNYNEIMNHVNGQFLRETPEVFKIGGGHQVRVDLFKGITPEQKAEILRKQAAQRAEGEAAREAKRQEEDRWALQEAINNRAAMLLEREKARKARELAVQLREENLRKAEEDRQRLNYINKVLYTNPPREEYFAQFNTTSR
ncbi:RIB43A-domain-containing protein [Zopfochytrium polystomum]|nr:RIB43A-domain-containing protein [Zopfochytrium polystomum]